MWILVKKQNRIIAIRMPKVSIDYRYAEGADSRDVQISEAYV